MARGEYRSRVVLDRSELERLLGAVRTRSWLGLRNRVMLEVMGWAGLRVGEVIDLSPGDVLWESSQVRVQRGKEGKTRLVPMSPTTIAWLRAWESCRRKPNPRLFTTYQGKAVKARYVQYFVKRYAYLAKLAVADRVSPHVLRHTFATLALRDGFNIREVQDLLGHASLSSTEVYLHVSSPELAAKVAARQTGPAASARE